MSPTTTPDDQFLPPDEGLPESFAQTGDPILLRRVLAGAVVDVVLRLPAIGLRIAAADASGDDKAHLRALRERSHAVVELGRWARLLDRSGRTRRNLHAPASDISAAAETAFPEEVVASPAPAVRSGCCVAAGEEEPTHGVLAREDHVLDHETRDLVRRLRRFEEPSALVGPMDVALADAVLALELPQHGQPHTGEVDTATLARALERAALSPAALRWIASQEFALRASRTGIGTVAHIDSISASG